MNFGEAYGHWGLVVINTMIFLAFAFSFFQPHTRRDWRTFGTFAAFLVALFTEMYGFPLTIYLLYGWLTRLYPQVDWLSHDASHLLQTLLGWEGNAHIAPMHLLSNILIVFGFIILAKAWRVLYRAQKNGEMAASGPYRTIRHPQYAAFILIMLGFLIQWPTLPTLIMFPILVVVYLRLAKKEENVALQTFGYEYAAYMCRTSRFVPSLRRVHNHCPPSNGDVGQSDPPLMRPQDNTG